MSNVKSSKIVQIVLYAILAVIILVSVLFVLRPQEKIEQLVAVISTPTQELYRTPLSQMEDGTFSIEEKSGIPITFEIKDNAIRFMDSNCPDKVCVSTGFQHRSFDISSCLPNGVLLVIESTLNYE